MKKLVKVLSVALAVIVLMSALPMSFATFAEEAIPNYSVDLSTVYDAAATQTANINSNTLQYLVSYNNVAAINNNANFNGFQAIIPATNNATGTLIYKFDAGVNSYLSNVSLSWAGRAIQTDLSAIKLYIAFQQDATQWIQIDSIFNANIYSTPHTLDLTDYIGSGVSTFYIKVSMYRVSGSWTAFSNLKVNGTRNSGTAPSVGVSRIKVVGIADGMSASLNSQTAFTAVATPATLSNTAVRITSSNETVVTITDNGSGNYTLNALRLGTAKLTLTSAFDETFSVEYNIIVSGLKNQYGAVNTVTKENRVDAAKFYDFDSAVMSSEVGATVKFANVSFADFEETGANFVKANVSYGAAGSGTAVFEVYADTITFDNLVATLYATPYGGSLDRQVAAVKTAVSLYDTHDIYVVLKTPGTALFDLTFANMNNSYSNAYTKYYGDTYVTGIWSDNLVNYSGLKYQNGKTIVPTSADTLATLIYRVDGSEDKTLKSIAYKQSGRAISSGNVPAGAITVYVSTDMNTWTQIGRQSGTGDTTATSWELTVTDNTVCFGAETAYVKVTVAGAAKALESWNMLQGVNIVPTCIETGIKGDATGDGVVNILDLVRFKKMAVGTAGVTVADAAFFAGKGNLPGDMVYLRKSLLGQSFTVDLSRYSVVAADKLPNPDTETLTPTIFDAMDLAPTSNFAEEGVYNSRRIQFCIDKYGFANLQGGQTYTLDTAITLDAAGDKIIGLDAVNKSELYFAGDSWYVLKVSSSNNEVKNLVVNQGGNYTTGIHLDTAVVQVNGASNTVIDNCVIESNDVPEAKGTNYSTGSLGTSYSCGLYLLNSTVGARVTNTTIQNNYYGVVVHASITEKANYNLFDNVLLKYNRSDGITFAGYAKITNSEICYNGYDCLNGSDIDHPIPGAGVYAQSNSVGFVVDNCEIYRNNGFNIDMNGAQYVTITNNNMYDSGWTQFEAVGYENVSYRNGISLSMYSMNYSTVTGNTVTNLTAGNRLDQASGIGFTAPDQGACIIAASLSSYSDNNTITGNTFTASCNDPSITCYGFYADSTVGTNNVISDNT